MSDTLFGYLLAGSALLLFTVAILVTRFAASRINLSLGFLIATSTNVVFAALAFALQMFMRPAGIDWNAQAFWLFVLAGGFSTYLGRWFFYESVVRFGPARASVFQVSSPLFTALIAWLLGEHLTLALVAGMLMTVGGLMLASYRPAIAVCAAEAAGTSAPADGRAVTRPGAVLQRLLQSVLLLGLGSSFAYAIGNVLRGSAVRLWNEPVLGALAGAVAGLALHMAFSPGKRKLLAQLQTASRSGIWLYALMGIMTISGQVCAISSMRYIPLSVATLVTLCTPVLILPLSYLLFKNQEGISAVTLVGSTLTLLGIFIIVMR